ncbi:MAG: nucleotidyltransferase domain-containing protein [Egibacteraceae bacterium]
MVLESPFDLPVEDIIALAQDYHVRELSLFGSVLRPDFSVDSDVDVLVEFEPDAPVGLFEFVRLQDELAALIGREADLVEKRGLKRFIRDEVLRSRRVLCMPRPDAQLLADIVEAAETIADFLRDFDRDRFHVSPLQQSAVVYQLLVIGEAASRISQELRDRHPEVEWRGAIGSHAVMARAALVMPMIWQTATVSVPLFRAQVSQILKHEFPEAIKGDE